MSSSLKPSARRRAKTLLAEAEGSFDGWSCPLTAGCCHFERTGREPYVTTIEWDAIEEELARQGRRLSGLRDDGACPFLTEDERCLVYRARPLGCRTFYCSLASGPRKPARHRLSTIVRELEDLTPNPSGARGGRPLSSWLREKRSGRRERRRGR